MTCREAIDFLMEYLDGELPPAVRAEFDRHLTVCTSCVAYLETYRATVQLEKAAFCDEATAAAPLPEELVQAILAARGCEK